MVNYLPAYLAWPQLCSALTVRGSKTLCHTCMYKFSQCKSVEERPYWPYCYWDDVLPLGKLLQARNLFYYSICPERVNCECFFDCLEGKFDLLFLNISLHNRCIMLTSLRIQIKQASRFYAIDISLSKNLFSRLQDLPLFGDNKKYILDFPIGCLKIKDPWICH